MPTSTSTTQRCHGRGLISLLAILGLLLIPVECSRVHGAHSIFTPPSALAAPVDPAELKPNAEPTRAHHGHRQQPGDSNQQAASHSPTAVSEIASVLFAIPMKVVSPPRLLRLLPLLQTPHQVKASGQATPSLVPVTAVTEAPGVPGMLSGLGDLLPPLPTVVLTWFEGMPPLGLRPPGPEPPPP